METFRSSFLSFVTASVALFALWQSSVTRALGDKAYDSGSVTMPPSYVCPNGYQLVGNTCSFLRVTQGTFSCPKNTDYFENGFCIKTEKVATVLKCPDGSTTDGKKCNKLDTVSPIIECGKNAEISRDGTSCISTEISKAEKTCPIGFQLLHNECILTKTYPRSPRCPPGYVLQTFGESKSDQCVSIQLTPPETSCPKEYEMRGGACVKLHIDKPINAKCPSEFKKDENDMCVRNVVVEPTEMCTSGHFDGSNKMCVVVDTQQVVPSCKKGYTYQGSACVKLDEAKLEQKCPKGYSLEGSNVCTRYESHPADYVCPAGSIAQDKECYETVESAPQMYCAKGMITQGGTCVETLYAKPEYVCATGYSPQNDGCVLETTVNPDVTCPPGAQLHAKHCLKYTRVPATLECKNGEPSTPEGCLSLSKKSPGISCPEGYGVNGDSCVRVLESVPHYLCPAGAHLHGEKCESTRKVTAQKVCPKNFIIDATGNCFNSKFAEPSLSCPYGFELNNGKCVHPKTIHTKKRLLQAFEKSLSWFYPLGSYLSAFLKPSS